MLFGTLENGVKRNVINVILINVEIIWALQQSHVLFGPWVGLLTAE